MVEIAKIELRKSSDRSELEKILENIKKALLNTPKDLKSFEVEFLRNLRVADSGYLEKTEVPVFRKYDYRFDCYNPEKKIAIEIEKTEAKYVWRILCKFSIGARKGKVNYAILICPIEYWGRNKKFPTKIFNEAIRVSKFISDILWVKNIAIIGYK